ncbi:MAG: hypothetical protein JWM28_2138 [Chitinophagaceae bacterium]|nr:hypothetical protein [Chitinophagaceae bacterium]
MIESLHLKSIATYDTTGVDIKELKKINFIYGVNGSGKTTLTKLVYAPKEALFKDCLIKWQNNLPLKALVYNKDFRDRNFGLGKMDGVFTLGQATKEETETIEKKIVERKALKDEWNKKNDTLTKLQEAQSEKDGNFREAVWVEVYKKHESAFKSAFAGYLTKEKFKDNLIDEHLNNKSTLLDYDSLKENAETIFGEVPTAMNLIQDIDASRLAAIEKDSVWNKKIVGKADVDIAKLIQRLNINDWVNEGRGYLQDNPTCPFCQHQTITAGFRKQLADYFDESFLTDNDLVRSYAAEYNLLTANFSNILQQLEIVEKANPNTKLAMETFSGYLRTLLSQVISNQELLNNKIKEPSRSITLIKISEQLGNISEVIKTANQEISKHNGIVGNFAKEKQTLVTSIWRYVVEDHKVSIQNFLKEQEGGQKGIDGVKSSIAKITLEHNALNTEVKTLSKNVTSVEPSIIQINTTLESFGFNNFSIVPSKTEANKYQILRSDGTIAESTMSEGEITFITFLYFLQLAKGSTSEASITEERILVIDDPISSLDSNVLFVVSSLLKELMKNIRQGKGTIKQIILLTHNVYFHKEVSFIDGRTTVLKDYAYWILRKNNQISTMESYGPNNPIQSSYQLLWAELKNRQNNTNLTIQNTMRRIIENYFKLLGKYGDEQLIQSFTIHEEQEICRSLICWINDGSHSIPDDHFIQHQADTTDRYFAVFKKIFEHTKHEEHYRMMMGEAAEEVEAA